MLHGLHLRSGRYICINSIAYAMGVFPKTWMLVDGKVVYSSITEENKEVLRKVAGWFKEGLVDPQLNKDMG